MKYRYNIIDLKQESFEEVTNPQEAAEYEIDVTEASEVDAKIGATHSITINDVHDTLIIGEWEFQMRPLFCKDTAEEGLRIESKAQHSTTKECGQFYLTFNYTRDLHEISRYMMLLLVRIASSESLRDFDDKERKSPVLGRIRMSITAWEH